MTIESSERDPAKTCNTDGCNAWATKQSDRKQCRNHGGETTGPKSDEGKQQSRMNALSHGLYALPEHLKEHFTEQQQDRYTAYFEAMCSRYERYHGHEPDEFAKDRLSRVAIECVKERIADEWLSEQADETGNLLIESYVIGQDDDGRPIEVEQENQILSELTALKRETRLTLKDMGLLEDDDAENQAAKELGDIARQALED